MRMSSRTSSSGTMMCYLPAPVCPPVTDVFQRPCRPTSGAAANGVPHRRVPCYARVVAATHDKPQQHWEDGQIPEAPDNHPVVFVSWHDTQAYAQRCAKARPSGQRWESSQRDARRGLPPRGQPADSRGGHLPRGRQAQHHPR
ncbi:SUMF1/EgtB/PvdO family nonheme iron enzyme [Actinomadura terrae]|uniref:SUMF1/EgtB/PvdO family nonheme iron enzyme n=1 Tax=Actinomadura terrae TaxID=604353 RepID=UPI003556137C